MYVFFLGQRKFFTYGTDCKALFHCKKNGNLEALDNFTSCENSHKFKQAEPNAEGKFAGCRQDVVHTVYTQNVVK